MDFSWIFDGIRLDRLASAGSGRSGGCWRREGSAGVEVFKIFIGANKCEGAMLMKSLIFMGGDFAKNGDFQREKWVGIAPKILWG